MRNQQASILNIEKQLGLVARQINEQSPVGLPCNTEQNPKVTHVKTAKYEKSFTPMTLVLNEYQKMV